MITRSRALYVSAPDPSCPVNSEEPAKQTWGSTRGSRGTSANAKLLIFRANGSVIGQVSVGIGETKVLDNQNIWLITAFSEG